MVILNSGAELGTPLCSSLSSQLIYNYSAEKFDLSDSKHGSYLKFQGKTNYLLTNHTEVSFKGELYLFDNSKNSLKSTNIDSRIKKFLSYRIQEYSLLLTPQDLENVNFIVGKSPFEFSTALMTSPGNPSMAGLSLISPLEQQEGILQSVLKITPNSYWSVMFGSMYGNGAIERVSLHPFLRVSYHKRSFDTWTIVSNRFFGLGVSYQIFPFLNAYFEGNLHGSLYEPYVYKSDFLVGTQASSYYTYFPIRISLEFYRNSEGLKSSKSSNRGLMIRDKISSNRNRDNIYNFPSPSSFRKSAWGSSSFLNRDYLFVDLRKIDSEVGTYMNVIQSLNDSSGLIIVGYKNQIGLSYTKNVNLGFQIEMRRFEGGKFSEFGEISRKVGQNQLWMILTL